jgi:hypothetical protein
MNRGGLTQLSTADLRKLTRLIYKDQLLCPFKRSDLLVRGLNSLADHGDLLIGQEKKVILLLISAVLSERHTWESVMESRIRKALHHQALDLQSSSH